ncbi:unnamed protein product [Symbiodinium necroappetens]|uniref:Reverse transcriptase domain-containing protein n=1 Tax=Symbiodinium necroappetens TaxID=1628268 RepID=A0A812NF78_9DINO|nr:unnamed protein product [Symbiodinium necroappetens]
MASRGRGQGLHLDLAAETPVRSAGNSPTKRGGEPGQGSAKRAATGEGGDAIRHGQVMVDMGDLARLLEETGNKIMKAQHEHLEARMGALEELTGKRMASAETRLGTVETKVDTLETKLDELAKKLEQGDRRGAEGDRRLTLVYGGWPRDSRRHDILRQLQRALEKLGVWDLVDSEPFTTGPRRSTALSTFQARQGEGLYEVRRRMHDIIRAVSDNEVTLAGGKKLFATYAKNKQERDIASHAAWIKRTVAAIAPGEVQRLDLEYSTGGAWIGTSFVGSAKQPLPPGLGAKDVVWDETKEGKHWVHVEGLARELGVSAQVSFPLYSWNAGGVAENNYARTDFDVPTRPQSRQTDRRGSGNKAQVQVAIAEGRKGRPYQTSPKIWIGGITEVSGPLDQQKLVQLAVQCTRVKSGDANKDPLEVKDAFRQARDTGLGVDWTAARKSRKQARAAWERARLERATSGDWAAYRQLRRPGNEGWDMVFAEAHDGKDPHQVIHDHLETIYTTGQVVPPLGPWEGDIDEFTMEELEQAIALGKKGKAVGVDGTSHEFLAGLATLPGGKEGLLAFFNDVYKSAQVPSDWNTALMVVIPKQLHPVDPKNMRVMELEAEWRRGIVMAKIDLHKAYDMVDRPALLSRLKAAIGDGPTYRSWHSLLAETDAVLQTGWDTTRLQLDRGIKQDSVESPAPMPKV